MLILKIMSVGEVRSVWNSSWFYRFFLPCVGLSVLICRREI